MTPCEDCDGTDLQLTTEFAEMMEMVHLLSFNTKL